MQTSLTNVQGELEAARERLKGVEENIKKSIGRDTLGSTPLRPGFKRTARQSEENAEDVNERTVPQRLVHIKGGRRNIIQHDLNTRLKRDSKLEDRIPAKKRLGEQTVTVFSRLSGPPKDDEYEIKDGLKSKVTSQVIVQDLPSRKDVLAAQSSDKQCKARNRRMFGALLGTLQKFRQEENRLKEKEEKRAQVEKKLEEAALREKEEMKKKRQELFSSRRQQQMEIRQLEYKLMRLKQLEEWESSKKHLLNFIQTSATPKIFYLPKKHTEKSEKLLESSQQKITKMIETKREEVQKAIALHATEKRSGVVIKVNRSQSDEDIVKKEGTDEVEENGHSVEEDVEEEEEEVELERERDEIKRSVEIVDDFEVEGDLEEISTVNSGVEIREIESVATECEEETFEEPMQTEFNDSIGQKDNEIPNGGSVSDKENCIESNQEGTLQNL